MIKILMHGCNGKMGRMITEIAKQDQDVEIVAGVDKYTAVANEYPVFETISECDVDADAVIDFSNAGAVDELLDYCVEKKLPAVLCTTGLSEEQLARVKEVSEKIAVLKSANMSMGINLLLKLRFVSYKNCICKGGNSFINFCLVWFFFCQKVFGFCKLYLHGFPGSNGK